jgi:protein-S-isoprenylcysteine O-methyltransferase Ste14
MDENTQSEAEPTRSRSRSGLGKFIWDLQHRRRRFRQLMGAVFVLVVTLLGAPTLMLLNVGAGLACLGMLVRLAASGFVMKNEVLATNGPYAFVRHPLYVGNLLICAGFCFASGVWWSVPFAIATLLLFYPGAIRYEDQKLQRLFPGQWDRWSAETRALIPRFSPYHATGETLQRSSWSLQLSMMRNGEPLHIVVMGACLFYLYTLV